MMTQKNAVFTVVTKLIGSAFKEGMDAGAWFKANPKAREEAVASLVGMFKNKEVGLAREQEDIKTYVGGLLSNHLRKDTRLNGGDKYVPANPGQGDPEIRELRKLLKSLEGKPEQTKVQAVLDARLKAKDAAKNTIDEKLIPEELRHLVS